MKSVMEEKKVMWRNSQFYCDMQKQWEDQANGKHDWCFYEHLSDKLGAEQLKIKLYHIYS